LAHFLYIKRCMRRLMFFLWMMLSLPMSAQYIVHGKVLDATSGNGLEMATVCLYSYSGKDSVLVQGAQTDSQGEYFIGNVQPGNYKLEVSMVGYLPSLLSVGVKDQNVGLPTIRLQEDVQLLQVLDVKGKAAEMVVKGDTIEYNTAAYNVGENAMVEDLLKKMNGVEVDKEGNVTVNGEKITSVRIDGKKFFGDDVQSATKNIPAEMIKKVQVIDEKSDMAKMTGFEDDETERIINLTLKDNRKKGVFGNYKGGLGADMVTDDNRWFNYNNRFFQEDFRYDASIFTNILLGESQTTIIGSANNTNDFRSGRGRGPFSGQNSGLTWAENVGVNTNIDLNKNITKRDDKTNMVFGGDVSFNHSKNDNRSMSNKQSYSNGVTYLNNDSTAKLSHSWDVNGRFELEYQIDSMNKVLVQPFLSYTNNQSTERQEYTYHNSTDSMLINDGYQDRLNNSEDISARVRVIYNHKMKKTGRSLTLNGNVTFTNTKGFTDTYAFDNLGDSAKVDQYTNTQTNALEMRLRGSWVEPIAGNHHFLETTLFFGTNLRHNNKDQYDMDLSDSTYQYNAEYSSRLNNNFFQEAVGLNYRYIQNSVDLTVGAQFNPSQTHSQTYYGGVLNRDTTIYAWNWSPNVRLKYKFGKKEFARVNYNGRSTQPSVTQMEPVRNNSNAMNETVGNLSLRPSFGHNLHAMYSKFNAEKFWSLMTGLHGSVTQDALVNNSIYDETGKLYQQTVNAEAIPWNLSGDLMFNTPFANKLLQFNTRTAVSYNQQISYISREGNSEIINQAIAAGQFILGDLSKTGNLRVNEDLTLRLTHDVVDLGVQGKMAYSRTQNSLAMDNITNVFDWTIAGDLAFHLPKSWNIMASCAYTARFGYDLDDVNEVLVNASIDKSWSFGSLQLKAFDILHQKKSIVQTVGENYVQYKKANTLPTYFMLTFTYKLNRMGDLKAKGMGGIMQEMIQSNFDPSKGTMPPGPPPFMR